MVATRLSPVLAWLLLGCATSLVGPFAAGTARAETLESALARAYAGNPTLGSTRAGVRAADENVPQALAGYRPQVSLEADIGAQRINGQQLGQKLNFNTTPGGAGLTVNQTLFNGFRTDSQTRQAESNVYGARETLRNTEMQVLFAAAQNYMNVLRDTANLELQRNNVEVLQEQLRQTRDRFNVGEVTRTDVAQAEARLAGARSSVSAAEAGLRASIASYRQIIGVEPRALAPGRPLDRFVPATLDAAVDLGMRENPQILSALHAVDAAEAAVKVAESQLSPQVGLTGAVQQRYDQLYPNSNQFSASIVGRVTIPIYEGGQVYAQVRQAKETAGQRQIEVETNRNAVRQFIVQSWGQLEAAKAQVIASQAQVQANEVALNGVREEARVGQRTTLDVLNAQQELLNSRVQLIIAQRDRVVYSYQVVQSIGRLTARFTALPVAQYSPKQHFDQVKDLWYGLRTPDGR
jgi:outer membrane protein